MKSDPYNPHFQPDLDPTTERKIGRLTRERMVEILEAHGFECYDDETKELLGEAILQNIEDGDIDVSALGDE